MPTDFVRGAVDALRGASFLLLRPRLWKWIIAPALVALVLLVVVVGWLVGLAGPPLAALVGVLPGSWGEALVRGAVTILTVLASLSVFVGLASLIAAPFNEMLSEAIEAEVTGKPGPPFRVHTFLWELVVGMAHAIRRVVVYLVTMAALLVATLVVPVVGAYLWTIGGAYVTARFASYDACDAVWARKHWRYRDKVAYLRVHRGRTLGLGAVIAALLIVPFVNLVALSIGAAGATLRYLDEQEAAGAEPASRTPAGSASPPPRRSTAS